MVTYRQANAADFPRINEFYNRLWGFQRTMEQFHWEFLGAPAGPAIYIVAEDDGKIIGSQCVIPITLVDAKGERIYSGKSEDTLLDPDYRGKGHFDKLYDVQFRLCEEAGMKVIWGFTPAVRPLRRIGFDTPYRHQQCLAVNGILPAYRYLAGLDAKNTALSKVKILGLAALSKMRFALSRHPARLLAPYTLREEPTPVGNETLLASQMAPQSGMFCILQDQPYQDWRIYQNPNYNAVRTFAYYDAGGRLVASFVFNIRTPEVAYFVQSLFHAELDKQVVAAMLHAVSKAMFARGIALIRNWIFSHNTYQKTETAAFEAAGFYTLERGISLVWKPLNGFQMDSQGFLLSRIATQGTV
jgi:GNAT superfamily N-acetyltransferase